MAAGARRRSWAGWPGGASARRSWPGSSCRSATGGGSISKGTCDSVTGAIYGERGVSGRRAFVWLAEEYLTVQFATEPLAQYRVAYERDHQQLRDLTEPRLFETRYRSAQPPLLKLRAEDWRLMFRLPSRSTTPPPAPCSARADSRCSRMNRPRVGSMAESPLRNDSLPGLRAELPPAGMATLLFGRLPGSCLKPEGDFRTICTRTVERRGHHERRCRGAEGGDDGEFFNSRAGDFDPQGAFAHFGQRLVAVVGVEPGQRVLDVATGRGAVLFPAVERVGAAGEAVGVDLAESMVRATNEEAERRGLGTPVRVMDAEQLDFPDAGFDRVLCGFGVMYFPHLDQALAEFRRVLKPGGRLGVSTWRASSIEDLQAVLDDLGLAGSNAHRPPGWITEPEVLAHALTGAGFTDVRVVADSEAFRYADIEHYWQSIRGNGSGRRAAALDAAQLERVRAALAERFRAYQRPDGIHVVATALLAVGNR